MDDYCDNGADLNNAQGAEPAAALLQTQPWRGSRGGVAVARYSARSVLLIVIVYSGGSLVKFHKYAITLLLSQLPFVQDARTCPPTQWPHS